MKIDFKDFWNVYKLFDKALYLDEERTNKEVSFIQSLIPLDTHKKILDLGCGDGRIAIKLGEVGYIVTGVDTDKEYIDRAKEISLQKNLSNVSFYFQDYRNFKSKAAQDAAILIYSSFGYTNDKNNLSTLKHVNSQLRKGGAILLDNLSPYWAISKKEGFYKDITERLTESDRNKYCIKKAERLRKLVYNNRYEKTIYRITDFCNRIYISTYKQRLFTIEDLTALLTRSNFGNIKFFGDFEGTTFNNSLPRVITYAEKL